jgi:hypothetical protein
MRSIARRRRRLWRRLKRNASQRVFDEVRVRILEQAKRKKNQTGMKPRSQGGLRKRNGGAPVEAIVEEKSRRLRTIVKTSGITGVVEKRETREQGLGRRRELGKAIGGEMETELFGKCGEVNRIRRADRRGILVCTIPVSRAGVKGIVLTDHPNEVD